MAEPPAILFPNLPARISGLEELAENLWWSWHPRARMLFKMLDRQAWKESGHNPDRMLRDIPVKYLEAAAGDEGYLREYDLVMNRFHQYLETCECRYLKNLPDGKPPVIAYFSAEFGLHRSLPFYAGGLGFLAGDHLKECSDLGVPLVAVGFMYPKGYLRQRIREDGWQENLEEPLDREAASITRVLDDKSDQVVVKVPLIEPPISVAVWKVVVGRVNLFLMDTDIASNDPWNRAICSRLYIGDMEQRLRQEIVLGIGGATMLKELGIEHYLLHLNEGHAAFALLERIREQVQSGAGFAEAREKVSATSIFTTHTPVPAGHDVFGFSLMDKYFHSYWPALDLDRDTFLQLGVSPEYPEAGFNMTTFALRLAAYRNGVSVRHAEVTRRIWACLWPDKPEPDIPIDSITNGVHVPTWVEPKMHLLFDKYLGLGWLDDHDNPLVWELLEKIPDAELWQTHYWLKIKLIDAIRERARLRWSLEGAGPSVVTTAGTFLDPSVLTIGFARRFATYKRADLILLDVPRLRRLLNDRWRPIQIVFAGKAHPADDPGKRIIQRLISASRDPGTAGRIAFVEDYGEQLAQYMVHGVDVWLNNPLPPMEACGTSGIKAAINGVPHLSIEDGWWVEGYNGQNGWIFGSKENKEDRDATDADALYRVLEEQVVPLYYDISNDGIPHGWVRLMREAIKSTAAQFSARRMVKDYLKKFYARSIEQGILA